MNFMGLLNVLLLVILLGFISGVVTRFLPMPWFFRFLVHVFTTLVIFLYVFQFFGLVHVPSLPQIDLIQFIQGLLNFH